MGLEVLLLHIVSGVYLVGLCRRLDIIDSLKNFAKKLCHFPSHLEEMLRPMCGAQVLNQPLINPKTSQGESSAYFPLILS